MDWPLSPQYKNRPMYWSSTNRVSDLGSGPTECQPIVPGVARFARRGVTPMLAITSPAAKQDTVVYKISMPKCHDLELISIDAWEPGYKRDDIVANNHQHSSLYLIKNSTPQFFCMQRA